MAAFESFFRLFKRKPEPREADSLAPDSEETTNKTIPYGSNAFACALYAKLCPPGGNLFFSPFSVRTVLCMAYAGAGGETATQMMNGLRLSAFEEQLYERFFDSIQRLKAPSVNSEVAMTNSLWAQQDSAFKSEFVDLVARRYAGVFNAVDFSKDSEGVRRTMNSWVEERTGGRISDLISPGAIGSDTRLVLLNAAYFKGPWMVPFSDKATRDDVFWSEGRRKVNVPVMYQKSNVGYFHSKGFKAVDLAYQFNDISMLILLPDHRDGLEDLDNKLTAGLLREVVSRLSHDKVEMYIPRFRMTWGSVDVSRQIAALGMTAAFDRTQADFSGINGRIPPDPEALFVSTVFHQAFVEVNEKGTEAAAATAVRMEFTAAFPPRPERVHVFRADHPFIFAIREHCSGAILFLGRLVDPTPVQ